LVIANDYEYLKHLECRAIRAFGTKVPNGYNMTDGGDGVLGVIVTDSGRIRRRQAQHLSFSDPERRLRHRESQRSDEIRQLRRLNAVNMSPESREKISAAQQALWASEDHRLKMANRPTKPKIEDGLSNWQRCRLKNLQAYRERKRLYAKTEAQRAKRTAYMRLWTERNRERANELARLSRARKKAKI
jgi:hypothetical protein